MPPTLAFDHIAIAAASLGEGIDFVEERLGVRVPLGGKHPIMNTHNAVMRLGEGIYLEVISIDPEAGPAACPRWFALDDPQMQARLRSDGPSLVAWIARSADIAGTVAASSVTLGEVRQMSRGTLQWQIAVRPDGSLPLGGAFPLVIEWPSGPHPSVRMADLGVRFGGLTLRAGRAEELKAALASIGADGLVEVKSLRRGLEPLEVTLVRPDGLSTTLTGGQLQAVG